MLRQNRTIRGAQPRINKFSNMALNTRVRRNAKMVHGAAPIRIQARKQLISIPDHNYQLRIRKTIRSRINAVAAGTPVTYADVFQAIHNELGLAAGIDGEIVTLHGVKFFASASTATATLTFPDLDVVVFDRENAGTVTANAISHFNDMATTAGIAHIAFIYPTQDRPSFNRAQTSVSLFNVALTGSGSVFIDFDVTYTRTPLGAIPYISQ